MAQAVDGAWYAYLVDADSSNALDSTIVQSVSGESNGLDYGKLCGPSTELAYKNDGASETGLTAGETQGVWIPYQLAGGTDNDADGTTGYSQGDTIADCGITAAEHTEGRATGLNVTSNLVMNLVREPPALSNQTTANEYGNIRLGPNLWPMIQMLDFSVDGTIEIVYNRAGADETVTLDFTDSADGLSFDKDVYGLEHKVGVTLTNWNLNYDPTDEDVWTFGTLPTNATMFYQLFDENGADDAVMSQVAADLVAGAGGVEMFTAATAGDISPAGVLTIDRNGNEATATTNPVIDFVDNADVPCVVVTAGSGLCEYRSINDEDQPVTFTEAGANSGVFINWDEALQTNMVINAAAPRGSQAIFAYDGINYGVMHNPTFGTIEYETDGIGSEWNSGEVVIVNLFDPDMNFDNRSEDVMASHSNNTIMPAIKIGSPITLATLSTLATTNGGFTIDSALNNQCSSDYSTAGTATSYTSCYEKYSERSIITTNSDLNAMAANEKLVFTHSSSTTVKTLTDLIGGANGTGAYTYIQYDLRGLNGGSDNLSFKGNFTFGDSSYAGGAVGDVAFYGTSAGTVGTSVSANVGPTYFEGLVGNTIMNAPLWKLVGTSSLASGDALVMVIDFEAVDTSVNLGAGAIMPLAVDIVTWGQSNDGVTASDRHNNAIYRLAVEEGLQ
jgi:hypothetical protein